VTIPAASTAALPSGTYQVTATYTNGAARASSRLSPIVVNPNPDSLTAGDTVSWAERTLAAIEAFLGGHLEGGVQYYMIGTRQVQAIGLDELWKIRRNLQAEVAAQRRGRQGVLGQAIAFQYHRPGVIVEDAA
jgi:hypothetical protein